MRGRDDDLFGLLADLLAEPRPCCVSARARLLVLPLLRLLLYPPLPRLLLLLMPLGTRLLTALTALCSSNGAVKEFEPSPKLEVADG